MSGGQEATFLDRLKVEHEQVFERTQKLAAFIDTTPFYALSPEDQADLILQHGHMTGYVGVLSKRLNRLNQRH